MYYYGRKRLPIDRPFNTDDYQYPADWLRNSTEEQRREIGITEGENPNLQKPIIDAPKYTEQQIKHFDEMKCLTDFIESVILTMSCNNFGMTVEEVKAEVLLLDLYNIRKYDCSPSLTDQFYSMWQRFGPQAARTAMIPYIWNNKTPRPSEYFGLELNV
tara:strand:+ start:236 stop:712 length:477 start_codon:yes stop_codon:yes gene_type:complete